MGTAKSRLRYIGRCLAQFNNRAQFIPIRPLLNDLIESKLQAVSEDEKRSFEGDEGRV